MTAAYLAKIDELIVSEFGAHVRADAHRLLVHAREPSGAFNHVWWAAISTGYTRQMLTNVEPQHQMAAQAFILDTFFIESCRACQANNQIGLA